MAKNRLLLPEVMFLLCYLYSTVVLAQPRLVSIATLSDYAPYCFIEGDLEVVEGVFAPGEDSDVFKGYSWDIVRSSFHAMGYSVDLRVSPWARAMFSLDREVVDVLFPTGKNSERLEKYNYSEEFVNEAKFLVYLKKGNTLQWRGLESLKGLTIGERRGFNYGDEWKSLDGVNIVKLSNIMQGFRMLKAGRIDGVVGYEFTWDYALKQAGWSAEFSKLPVFDVSREYLVALKTNPQGKQVLQAFDQGKRKLQQENKLAEIEQRWR